MKSYPSIFNHVLGPVAPGPSSSNTAAPYRIGDLVRQIVGRMPEKVFMELASSTSFARTFLGSKSDLALISGLLGKDKTKYDIAKAYKDAKKAGLAIEFDTKSWKGLGTLKGSRIHVDDMVIIADSTGGGTVLIKEIDGCQLDIKGDSYVLVLFTDAARIKKLEKGFKKYSPICSTGDDKKAILTVFYSDPAEKKELEKLVKENEKLFRKASFLNPVHPVVCREKAEPPFQTAKEMEAFCRKKRCSIWQAAVKYEAAISGWSEKAVFDYATELWDICLEGIGRGAEGNFDINGMITPKANQLLKKYINKKNKKFFSAGILDFAVPLSLGVMEYSNSAGIIVCLPTGGSSGIVPAAIYSAAPDVSAMVKAFLTAGVIGVIMARTNNFSGGGLGCQAEIGCGAAMAAGALVQLLGGTVRQACDAASMTLQCLSGLVCDPVAGTVQVPCIARNMSATATAFVCANAVMAGFDPVIPFDEEHDAFVTIGKIVCKCKGIGATTTPTGQKIAAELQKKYTKSRKV